MATVPVARHLSPVELIVNIGWATGKILVLEMTNSQNFVIPTFELLDVPPGSKRTIFRNAFTLASKPPPPPLPPIVNPISKAMLQRLRMWNKKPRAVTFDNTYFIDNETVGHYTTFAGSELIFMNVTKVKALFKNDLPSFTFKVKTPAEGAGQTHTETNFYAWADDFGAASLQDNFDHPIGAYPDLRHQPSGVIPMPSAFDSAADRDAFVALYTDGHVHAENTTDEVTIGAGLAWTLRVSTYKKRKDFPTVGGGWALTQSVIDTASSVKNTDQGAAVGDVPFVAKASMVSITVNVKTLALTLTKV